MSYDLNGLSAAVGVLMLMIATAMVFSKGFFERPVRHMMIAAGLAIIGTATALSGAVMYLIERISLS